MLVISDINHPVKIIELFSRAAVVFSEAIIIKSVIIERVFPFIFGIN